jgi:hypothetical protein
MNCDFFLAEVLLSTKSSATNAAGSKQDRKLDIETQSISTSTASGSTTNIGPIESTTTETDTTRKKGFQLNIFFSLLVLK